MASSDNLVMVRTASAEVTLPAFTLFAGLAVVLLILKAEDVS